MKNTLTLLTCLFCIQFLSGQNFRPVSAEFKNLYFTQDGVSGGYFSPKGSHIRMDFDSVYITSDTTFYYTYRTARYEEISDWNCQYLEHHNWLGYAIIQDELSATTDFYFQPTVYNEGTKVYDKNWGGDLRLNYNDPLMTKWYLDFKGYFEGQFISLDTIQWEGLSDTIMTIEVNNLNPAYDWTTGYIKISKNHGLVSFPNLQFFPFKWISCDRVGLSNPQAGVQEPTQRDMFHMEPGDEYTAEYNYELQAGGGQHYYKNVKCLSILSDVNDEVSRYVEINIYKIQGNAWNKETTFETQTIDYKTTLPFGKSNQYIGSTPDNFSSYLCVLDSIYRKLKITLSGTQTDNCINQPTDGCNNYFSYKGAFDTYHECNGGWNKYDYYLPRYIKNGDDIWGEDVNFDSLLATSKIVWNDDFNFYPNPNTGIFSFDKSGINEYKEFRAVNIMGKEFSLMTIETKSQTNLQLNAPEGVYFIYAIDKQNRSIGLGRVVKSE